MNRIFFALLVVSLGCIACDDDDGAGSDAGLARTDAGGDDDMNVNVGPFEETLTAVIDGEPFAAQLVAGGISDGLLRFQSDQSQERQLFFTLPAAVGPGRYTLTADGDYIVEYAELFIGQFPAESGHLVVDTIDRERKEISGTFEFVGAMDTFGEITRVVITEGKFSVEYTEV